CRAVAAYGLGDDRRTARNGRAGDHQHQDLCRWPPPTRPRPRLDAVARPSRFPRTLLPPVFSKNLQVGTSQRMPDLSKPRQEPRMDAVSAISPSRCCVRLGPLPVMSCPHLRSQPPFSDLFSVCRVTYDYGNFICLIPTMILLAPPRALDK